MNTSYKNKLIKSRMEVKKQYLKTLKNIVHPYCHYKDERGEFSGLINSNIWQEINIVKTNSGAVRGKHYHKHTLELIFLLKGKVKIELNDLDTHDNSCSFILNQNEGILIQPNVVHTFYYQEKSEQISFLDKVFDANSPDIHMDK